MHNKTAAESRQEVQHSFQLTAPPSPGEITRITATLYTGDFHHQNGIAK